MKPTCLLLVVTASACASIEPQVGHDQVAALVRERTGEETGWSDGPPAAEQVTAHVNGLLDGGLDSQKVVAIALLNSPSLRTTYEELGISQAEMVQAGLLRNPTLAISVGAPLGPGQIWEQSFSLVQDFLDLFILPLRRDVAAQQFGADVSRVAAVAFRTAAEASEALVEVQAEAKRLELHRTVLAAARVALELAERQFEAGNIPEVELMNERARQEQSRLAVVTAEQDVVRAREVVNQRLGLFGAQTQWTVATDLVDPPEVDPSLEHVESRAIGQRLDVEAARRQVRLFQRALDLTKTWRWIGRLEVGIDTHIDPNGPRLLGPSLVIELPLFDQRQAAIARLEAQVRQSFARLELVSITARSEVRLAVASMTAARARADVYRMKLLPMRARVVELDLRNYNAMQIGLFQLLNSRQQHVEAMEGYVTALRDYWRARVELNAAVGSSIEPQHRGAL